MEYLTTGQLAKEAGVNIDTVRYYEKRGLVPKPPRKDSGYRMFKEDAIKRIVFIKHAQEIGFSLREIEELLFLRVNSRTTCREVKKKTEAKIAEVENKILKLLRIKRALEKMVDICRTNARISECPVLDMLDGDGKVLFSERSGKHTETPEQELRSRRSSSRCPSHGIRIKCGPAAALGKNPQQRSFAIKKSVGGGEFPEGKSLMDRIGDAVKGRLTEARLSAREGRARKYILKEFARTGKPPSVYEITDAMKVPSLESARLIVEKLYEADILAKERGRIISAYPFSAKATRHKVTFKDGREVYALCATDALGVHFMLHQDIYVRSRCPQCENEMKIEVKDGTIASCVPKGVVQFVSNGEHGGRTAKTFCPFMNFFCSRDHLGKWRKNNPAYGKGEMYSLSQALEHGKNIFGGFLK